MVVARGADEGEGEERKRKRERARGTTDRLAILVLCCAGRPSPGTAIDWMAEERIQRLRAAQGGAAVAER